MSEINIMEYIVEQGVIGVTIGSILGFSLNNLTTSFKNNILSPYLLSFIKKQDSGPINFASSIIEFLIILLFIYLMYEFFIFKVFKNEMTKIKKEQTNEKRWERNMLHNIQSISDYHQQYNPYNSLPPL